MACELRDARSHATLLEERVVLIAISGCTEPMQAEPGDTNGSGGAAVAERWDGRHRRSGRNRRLATSPRLAESWSSRATADCNPHAITRGPDGNVWFTEWAGTKSGGSPCGTSQNSHSIPKRCEDITAGRMETSGFPSGVRPQLGQQLGASLPRV